MENEDDDAAPFICSEEFLTGGGERYAAPALKLPYKFEKAVAVADAAEDAAEAVADAADDAAAPTFFAWNESTYEG